MKIVAGLDLSLTATGLVVLNENLDILCSDTIKSKRQGVERLAEISNKIFIAFGQFDCKPDLAVIEGYAFHGISKATYQIGELGGVVRLSLYNIGVPFVEVAPQQLKKFVIGKGNAKKDMMPKAVFKKWGFDAATSHEADAFSLAMWGLATSQGA